MQNVTRKDLHNLEMQHSEALNHQSREKENILQIPRRPELNTCRPVGWNTQESKSRRAHETGGSQLPEPHSKEVLDCFGGFEGFLGVRGLIQGLGFRAFSPRFLQHQPNTQKCNS